MIYNTVNNGFSCTEIASKGKHISSVPTSLPEDLSAIFFTYTLIQLYGSVPSYIALGILLLSCYVSFCRWIKKFW